MHRLSYILLLVLCTAYVHAQVITDRVLLGNISLLKSIHQSKPVEKLYLQTDKPYYTLKDTLRFKAYLLKGDYLTSSDLSGILYVELDDADGVSAKRIMVPVTDGLAWGDIALAGDDIKEGGYTLRAYTKWQRNFGEDYFFKKNINIASTGGETILVNAGFAQNDGKIASTLRFTSLDGHVLALKDLQFKVMNKKKNLSKDKLTTGVDGTVKVNFAIPESAKVTDLSIKVQDPKKGFDSPELTVPVIINRLENTDVQFMPEGGTLIADIKAKVGFKAISEDGKGTNITGRIVDSKQSEVAAIKATHAGMGSFTFIPKAGETYSAKINGISKTYNLPLVKTTGTVLRVEQTANNDSLQLIMSATADIKGNYYLIGQSRGVPCYAQAISFNGDQTVNRSVAKDKFPTGIARFTLINQNHQPVNERQTFVNHNDNLNITVETDKINYTTRDSVGLVITVKDKGGKPVQGNFSLAVTDNSQVKSDSLQNSILSSLLLTSDLKGNIEEPNYYFINPKQKEQALDNLLLTQGWIGYDWQEVFYPGIKPIVYQPEKEFTVEGKVKNVFGKAIEKSNVILLLNKPFAVRDTLTNSEGNFSFINLFPLDSAVINLQARNKRGKEFNVGITVDEFRAPDFKPVKTQPWYTNIDTTLLKNTQTKAAQMQAIADYNGEGRLLKQVNIVAKKIVKDSKNLNGPGEADEILDEEFFHKANHKSLQDLLYDKYKSFFTKEFDIRGSVYRLKNHIVNLFIDGLEIKKLRLQVEDYMNYLSAEDIKGIEIMNSVKYATAYNFNYPHMVVAIPDRFLPIYLEVTTYSGNGAFMKKIPGTYLYRPLPFTLAKQFYSPRYNVKNKDIAKGTDLRSTLYWEPNIFTGTDGKANISFYTADKPANYTLVIEGADLNGSLGYKEQHIVKSSPQ